MTEARLTAEKLAQAQALVAGSGFDAWLTFVRETAAGGDPVVPLLVDGGLTWQSALIITPAARVAVVGAYDADPLRASGDWDRVLPYDRDIRAPLVQALGAAAAGRPPRVAVNFSRDDVMADGLTHGMHSLLLEYLRGTGMEERLGSAEAIVRALRGRKSPAEVARIRAAVRETESLLDRARAFALPGRSEREVFDFIQRLVDERGLGYSWDRAGDPIVNSGPDSMIGHGTPSERIRIAPGHLVHVDLGVTCRGYGSDLQRTWYVPEAGEDGAPADVRRALDAVTGAISAGAAALRPGVLGRDVDAAARGFLTAAGWPEYRHALGHQVGRLAHDGGGLLAPPWERYGRLPDLPVERDQVYTLELGVMVAGRGYLGIEEMVLVTESGCEWLSRRARDC